MKVVIVILLLFCSGICSADTIPNKRIIDKVISTGESLIGMRYRGRVKGFSRSIDCSGLMVYMLESADINTLKGSSRAMANIVTEISIDSVRRGDILFFKGRNSRSRRIGHVGMVYSHKSDTIIMIHSDRSGVSKIVYNRSRYYKRRLVKAGRISYENRDSPFLYQNKPLLTSKVSYLLAEPVYEPLLAEVIYQEVQSSIKRSKRRRWLIF